MVLLTNISLSPKIDGQTSLVAIRSHRLSSPVNLAVELLCIRGTGGVFAAFERARSKTEPAIVARHLPQYNSLDDIYPEDGILHAVNDKQVPSVGRTDYLARWSKFSSGRRGSIESSESVYDSSPGRIDLRRFLL